MAAWLAAAAASDSAALTVREAVERAVRDNAEVQSAEAEVEAAAARIGGASLLLRHNPEVRTAGGSRRDNDDDQVEWSIELSQPVEIAGQRSARIEAATLGLRRAEARLMRVRSDVAASARTAFGRAMKAEAIAALARENSGVAMQTVEAARERHRAGSASLIEVHTAELDHARVGRESVVAERERVEAIAELRRLVALAPSQPVTLEPSPADRSWATRDGAAIPTSREALLQMAYRQRGDLREAESALAEANAEAALAAREAVATPSFGVSYSREEGADVILGVVTVPLPIFDRNQAARGVADARVGEAAAALHAARLRVDIDVDLALARLDAATAATKAATESALDAARQNRRLADEGYRAGKLDVFQLMTVRRDAIDAEKAGIESLEDLNAATAELERAVGGFGAAPNRSDPE